MIMYRETQELHPVLFAHLRDDFPRFTDTPGLAEALVKYGGFGTVEMARDYLQWGTAPYVKVHAMPPAWGRHHNTPFYVELGLDLVKHFEKVHPQYLRANVKLETLSDDEYNRIDREAKAIQRQVPRMGASPWLLDLILLSLLVALGDAPNDEQRVRDFQKSFFGSEFTHKLLL